MIYKDKTYSYDTASNLISTNSAQYMYDGLGERVEKDRGQ